MFTVAVFKIAKTWKLKFPLIKDLKKYMGYIHIHNGIFSRKKKFLPFTTTWMDLKG